MTIHHKPSEREQFLGRLTHLAAFQGQPNWSFDQHRATSRSDIARRQIKRVSSINRLVTTLKKISGGLRSRIAEYRLSRQNIREFQRLNDHVLRDIGLQRGDIAAIASNTQSVAELNQLRETLARPVCQILEFDSGKNKVEAQRKTQLIDNAA